ncbi:MAG: SDR family oxidoreductase [Thermodesulfovibrionales bacterium]
MTNLKNQTVVITGASSGIGRAIAQGLAVHGSSLCLIGRNVEALEVVAAKANQSSDRRIYKADLASVEDIQRIAENIKNDVGHVDILIHSAGDYSMGLIRSAPVEELDRQYSINLRAPYVLTQALFPVIRRQGGQVVFINSSVGLQAKAKVSQYAASKHALKAFADSLREEVNGDGIRVLSIFPGRTATPMQETVHRFEGRAYDPSQFMQPEDVAAVVINALALPQSAEVTDINIRPMKKI